MFTAPPSFATRPLSKVRSSEEWHKKLMLINVQMVNAAGTEQQRALVPRIPTARCLFLLFLSRNEVHCLHFQSAIFCILFLLCLCYYFSSCMQPSLCLSVCLCLSLYLAFKVSVECP